MFPILVLLISFVAAWTVTRALIPVLTRRRVLDIPNGRSSHVAPTPRGGGIGIIVGLVAGVAAGWLLGLPVPAPALLAGVTLIAIIGVIDDYMGGLSATLRLALQFLAAGIVVYADGGLTRLPLPEPLAISTHAAAVPLALVWIVGVTNIYNFLDGIDGFAALQAVIAGCAIAIAVPHGVCLAAGLGIAGAALGFLLHNWHRAKIFMGDIGSATLGFAFAALPFQLDAGARGGAVFAMGLFLWPFLSDGAFTMFRRLFDGENLLLPHRSHLYQRLVISGLSHDQVAVRVLGGGAVLAALAVVAERSDGPMLRWVVLAVAIAGFWLYRGWTGSRESIAQQARSVPAMAYPQQRTGT
jgi:UDP-N-acetylmuramyl pentapeptide phosphotransferase/UDP-N-acetylglucosamine-1-phosphate transferase